MKLIQLSMVVALGLWSVEAQAYNLFGGITCNGQVFQGLHQDVSNFWVESGASANFADFSYARTEWNNVVGMNDRFGAPNQCTYNCAVQGDGAFDVNSINDPGAGFWGLTTMWSKPCNSPFDSNNDGHVIEADITINNANSPTAGLSTCDNDRVHYRGFILHELGHVLGMDHFSTAMSLMNNTGTNHVTNPHGKYCGSHALAPHPDDVKFARIFHGNANSATDAAFSGFMQTAANTRTLTMAAGVQSVCPGNVVSVTYSWANLGNQSLPLTNYQIVLSEDSVITSSDIVVLTAQIQGGAQTFSTFTNNITIPSSILSGKIYRIGVLYDPSNVRAETIEDNNATYLGKYLSRSSSCP